MFEIKIKVEIERLDDILAAMHGFTSAVASAPAQEPVVDAPKRRRTKAKAEDAAVAEQPAKDEAQAPVVEQEAPVEAPIAEPIAEPAAEPVVEDTPAPVATKEEVTELCKQVAMKAGGNPKVVVDIIQAMGFPGLTKVPENKLGELAAALRVKLAE